MGESKCGLKMGGRRKTKKRRRKSVILKRIFSLRPFSS